MRGDVRDATCAAARDELELNDTYVALVSRGWVKDVLASDTGEFMASIRPMPSAEFPGMLELVLTAPAEADEPVGAAAG